jgi:GNAT superfamily N-acetyltransferase
MKSGSADVKPLIINIFSSSAFDDVIDTQLNISKGMMPLILFRQATMDDAPNLKQIAKRFIAENYTPFLGAAATTAFIESGMADKEIDDGLNNCTLMVSDGRTIGFAIANGNVLHLLMIDVSFQRMGNGSALLSHMEEKLFTGHRLIRLQTFRDNTPAARFYLNRGWARIDQATASAPEKDMLRFEKHKNAPLPQQ